MTLSIKHKFVSPKADGGDTTIVRPSNWNDSHNILLAAKRLIGRALATDGDAEEIIVGTSLTLDATTKKLDVAGIGAIDFFPQTSAPTGYLKANGALLNRGDYPLLWAYAQASGNLTASDAAWTTNKAYGSFSPGDGSTTFRIPDIRGYFLRALDDTRGIDASRAIGVHQDSANLAHNHGVTDAGHTHGKTDPGHNHGHSDPGHSHATHGGSGTGTETYFAYQNGLSVNKNVDASGTGMSNIAATTGITINNATTGITIQNNGAAEARPINIALLACIRY